MYVSFSWVSGGGRYGSLSRLRFVLARGGGTDLLIRATDR